MGWARVGAWNILPATSSRAIEFSFLELCDILSGPRALDANYELPIAPTIRPLYHLINTTPH